jgi:hypothetical protein
MAEAFANHGQKHAAASLKETAANLMRYAPASTEN